MVLVLLVDDNVRSRVLETHSLRNLAFEILLESSCDRVLKVVRVSLVLLVIDGEVLGHCIASVLVDNCGLVLGEPVDRVGLFPVVLGQDVLGAADLVDDVVLCTVYRTSCGSCHPVRICWRYILVNAASEVQADKNCFHFPS